MSNLFFSRLFFLVLFFVAGAASVQAQTNLKAANKSVELQSKVKGVNMLYGTGSKVWTTDRETDASGKEVPLTDTQKQDKVSFFANGTMNMTGVNGAVSGKYTLDQASKTITMIFDGTTTNTFAIETLSDKKLTLKSPDGSAMMLKAE